MRRGSIASLIGIGVVAGGIAAAVALALPWLPKPASAEADRIDPLFWFVIVICIVVFAVVIAVILYSIIHFRAAPDDDSDGPPVHGHTGLEIVWTLIPTVLVTAIGIVSAIVLARNDAQGANVLHVNVTAQQFAWSFSYPDANGLTSGTLRLPKDRSVLLTLHSKDVIHSFWVPEFSQKEDTVPGITTTLHITPNRLGTFPVICTELCGLGHSVMRTEAIVMSPGRLQQVAPQPDEGRLVALERRRGRCGLQEQPVRRLPHAEGRGRVSHDGARPRQAPRAGAGRRQAARGFHPAVDRRPECVHPEGLSAQRDARHVRQGALQAGAGRARPVPGQLEQEGVSPSR